MTGDRDRPIPTVEDPEDPRLDDFRHLTDPELRVRVESERGIFIVESPLAVEALVGSPHAPRTRTLLVGEKRLARMAPAIRALRDQGAAVLTASAAVLEATAGFALHRGVVASVERPEPRDPTELVASARTVLAVEGVNDHENLGSLFRVAAAFGVDAVLLDPTCADVWYRRCVRVSMGHALRIPHARASAWPDPLAVLAADGRTVVSLTPSGSRRVEHLDVPADAPLVVVVGAEGPGLAPGTLALAGAVPARIGMAADVDSLNVGVAAAVALSHLRSTTLR